MPKRRRSLRLSGDSPCAVEEDPTLMRSKRALARDRARRRSAPAPPAAAASPAPAGPAARPHPAEDLLLKAKEPRRSSRLLKKAALPAVAAAADPRGSAKKRRGAFTLQRERAALLEGRCAADADPEATCRICLMPLVPCELKDRLRGGGSAALALPCGHLFHRECIREWTRRQQRCPVCRAACPVSGLGPVPQAPLGSPPPGYLYSRRDFRLGEHGSVVSNLVDAGILDSHPGVALQRLHIAGVRIPLVSEAALSEAERLEAQVLNLAPESPPGLRFFGVRMADPAMTSGVLRVVLDAVRDLRGAMASRRQWSRSFVLVEGLTRLLEDFDEWTSASEVAVQSVVGMCSTAWAAAAVGVARHAPSRDLVHNYSDALRHAAAVLSRLHDLCEMANNPSFAKWRAHARLLSALARASEAAHAARGVPQGGVPQGGVVPQGVPPTPAPPLQSRIRCAPPAALRRAVAQLGEPLLLSLLDGGAGPLLLELEELWAVASSCQAEEAGGGESPGALLQSIFDERRRRLAALPFLAARIGGARPRWSVGAGAEEAARAAPAGHILGDILRSLMAGRGDPIALDLAGEGVLDFLDLEPDEGDEGDDYGG